MVQSAVNSVFFMDDMPQYAIDALIEMPSFIYPTQEISSTSTTLISMRCVSVAATVTTMARLRSFMRCPHLTGSTLSQPEANDEDITSC